MPAAIPRLEAAFAKEPSQANRVALAMAYLFDKQLPKALPLMQQAVGAAPPRFRSAHDVRPRAARFQAISRRQPAAASLSAYHSIQVYDEDGKRTLSFNGSWETTMSLTNPLTGHFEYTEYFQMPWLWNHNIKRVLMEGIGRRQHPARLPALLHQRHGGRGGD